MSLFVKVGIQHTNRCTGIHGQIVTTGRRADGLWRGGVIDAEGLLLIWRNIGMYPGHSIHCVVANNGQADLSAVIVYRNGKSVWESPFNEITSHKFSPFDSHFFWKGARPTCPHYISN